MNGGAFGENFPYTNFHDLNLDWIIKEIKESRANIEDFQTELEAMGVSIDEFREYIDNVDEKIQRKITEEVPVAIQNEIETGGFNQLLSESHKRRIVFIGDSYGQGWTPDGSFEPWPSRVAGYMGLATEDWYNSSQGGAGFGKPSSAGNQYVPKLIQNAHDNISNPETVTDIVIGLGYNDYLYASDTNVITNGITVAIRTCKQYFPMARIHVFAIGFTTNKAVQVNLSSVYKTYKETIADTSFYNISQSLCRTEYFSSDGIHPVFIGQNAIATNILRCLNGSTPIFYITDMAGTLIDFNLNVGGDTQAFNNLVDISVLNNKLYLRNTYFKLIALGTGLKFDLESPQYIKLAKLNNLGNFTGFYTKNPTDWSNAYFYCSHGSVSNFELYPAQFTLAQDMDNNDSNVYLWIKLLGMSGTGFLKLTDIYRFGIMGLNYELPFMGSNV